MSGLLLGLLVVGTIGLPLLPSPATLSFVDTFTSLDAGDGPMLTGLAGPGISGAGGPTPRSCNIRSA